MSCPCHAPTRPFFSKPQHSTAVDRGLCCSVLWPCEERHGHGMASVNQTRPRCVNQMGKTHSKPLAARHGNGMLCVIRPLLGPCTRKMHVQTTTRARSGTHCERNTWLARHDVTQYTRTLRQHADTSCGMVTRSGSSM